MLWLMYGVGLFVTATAAGLIASSVAHGLLVLGLGIIGGAGASAFARTLK